MMLFEWRYKIMAQWYIKELSELTHVSVQTLHYYDKIDLLRPSLRHTNGYRIYSESDLLKLQKIIALKFFLFELAEIKKILVLKVGAIDALNEQSQLLKKKTKLLHGVYTALDKAISYVKHTVLAKYSLPWKVIFNTIANYHNSKKQEIDVNQMMGNLDGLKEYLRFEDMLRLNFTEKDRKLFDKQWADLIKEIVSNLDRDPAGDFGIVIAVRIMELMETLNSKVPKPIENIIWEKGFKAGKILSSMSPETLSWVDSAMDAYWRVHSD
jgi:DNA-binding transcriptional MerR regulator